MTQREIEKRLTQLQSEDRTNPEIYDLLVTLIGNMLKSQNWMLSPIDFDNVTHDVAADLYMKVYTGDYTVEYWRAIAYKMLKFTYVKKQRKLAMTETFDTGGDPIKKEQLYKTRASCINDNGRAVAIAENKAFLKTIPKVIDNIMKDSKFNTNSSDYMSLYTSVALTLLYNEDKYFHVKDDLKPYVHIIAQQVKEYIQDSGFFSINDQCDFMSSSNFDTALMPDLEFLGLV